MASQRFPILFISPSRIGDAVLSSGLLWSLAEGIEGASFTIVASELTAPLFAETPGLRRTIIMEKRRFGGHWLDLWGQVRDQRWGLVVDLRGSALARVLRPRRRAVHRPGGASEGGRLMLLGGPRDREIARSLRATVSQDRLIDLVGRESLLVTYAALK